MLTLILISVLKAHTYLPLTLTLTLSLTLILILTPSFGSCSTCSHLCNRQTALASDTDSTASLALFSIYGQT